MEASYLQNWLLQQLIDEVAANWTKADREHWRQWWQGHQGQAFLQGCLDLWATFDDQLMNMLSQTGIPISDTNELLDALLPLEALITKEKLQSLLQKQTIDEIAANWTKADQERWSQWWQGHQGQAFLQGCMFLWITFDDQLIEALRQLRTILIWYTLRLWLQLRLLQPITTSLLYHDVERWQRWWLEEEGHQFWWSCKWLWGQFGFYAIDAVLLYLEANLPNADPLTRWVHQWRDGDKDACWQAAYTLREKHSAKVARFTSFLLFDEISDRTVKGQDIADEAFWQTMEELDLKVSEGRLLTERTVTKIVRKDGKELHQRVFLGLISGRDRLGEHKVPQPLVWLGPASFESLFKSRWYLRCRSIVRGPVIKDRGDSTSKDRSTKQHVKWVRLEKMTDPASDGDRWACPRDQLRDLSKTYKYLEERWHDTLYGGVAKAQLLYLKVKILEAVQPSREKPLLEDPQLAELVTLQVKDHPLEDILSKHVEVESIEVSDKELWSFIQKVLNLSTNHKFRLKAQFNEKVERLPQDEITAPLQDPLLKGMWLRRMKEWVADCATIAEHLPDRYTQILSCVEGSLRWLFAKGHPQHRYADFEFVQQAPIKQLFKVHNLALLYPQYPTGEEFQLFIETHCQDDSGLDEYVKRLAELHYALEHSNPRKRKKKSSTNEKRTTISQELRELQERVENFEPHPARLEALIQTLLPQHRKGRVSRQ